MGLNRLQQLITHIRPGSLYYPKQRALAWAIDISIEQPNAFTRGRQCYRKID